jgi:hypothetical protein
MYAVTDQVRISISSRQAAAVTQADVRRTSRRTFGSPLLLDTRSPIEIVSSEKKTVSRPTHLSLPTVW